MNPFNIGKRNIPETKVNPLADISSSGRIALLITIMDASQSLLIQKISSMGGQKCVFVSHQHMNKSKGIIYVSEFDIEDDTILQEGLVRYGFARVEPAAA